MPLLLGDIYSFFFKSSFATAEFRGCSCCEDKNLAGSNQRPFELTQQTMKLCVTSRAILHLMTAQPTQWSRAIQHLMTAQPTHWSRAIQLMMTALIASHPTPDDRSTNPFRTTITSHPTFDDRSTDHEPSSAHPTLDDCSTYRPMDTITAPLPFNNIHL